MKKIIILLLLLLNISQASFLLDKNSPACIEDFYYKSSRIYYLDSKSGDWKSTSEDHTSDHIRVGYEWDADNEICKPKAWLILGMDVKDFHFLEALTGLLFGFVFLVGSIYLFVTVGGKR